MKKVQKICFFSHLQWFAGMHIYNRVVDSNAERKNCTQSRQWPLLQMERRKYLLYKTGTGEPILLIHDTDSGASGEEWAKVAKKLAKEQYRIHYWFAWMWPLGQAFHPIYKLHVCTDYHSLCKWRNGKPVNVAATNLSTAPVIMANALSKDYLIKSYL